jgi:GNAT superfamily N-acetyltransferase
VYVVPEHRRRGIGRALLNAALEWGRGEGCDEAELDVLVANPARALYEGAGFRDFEMKMTLDL